MKNNKLELIRGLAALMVFLCHCGIKSSALGKNTAFHQLTNWGTESVIVFFLLSGIVIHISQKHNPKSGGQFLLNRCKRIYPAYILGLILAFLLMPMTFAQTLGNLFFLGSQNGNIVFVPKENAPVWSLSFEMFFYIVFYFYLLTGSAKWFLYVWGILGLVCIPIYYLQTPGVLGQLIAQLAFSVIWLMGYLISEFIARSPKVSLQQAFFSFGLLFLAARIKITGEFYCVIKYTIFSIVSLPVFIFCLQKPAQNTVKKFSWIWFAAAYVALLATLQLSSDSLRSSKIIYSLCPFAALAVSFLMTSTIRGRILQIGAFLGYISYSLYIIHYPLLGFLAGRLGNINGYIFIAIALALIIPLSYGVELLSRKLIQRRRPSDNRLIPQA